MELIEKQQAELNEGHALYIKNMVDKAGQPFNAYAKFDKEGNVKGLAEQIEKLTSDEGTKFLFEAQKQQQNFKGFQPGASAQQKPGAEVDTSKMNYDELCAYLAENPDANLGE